MYSKRKRIVPVTQAERGFYLNKVGLDEECRQNILNGEFLEEELNIPALDRLERKIKK